MILMIIKTVISVLAFILLAPMAGAILTGITNKISARSQGRSGSSIMQPWADTMALLDKGKGEKSGIQGYYVKVSLFLNIVAGSLFFAGTDMLLVIGSLGLSIIFIVIAAYTSGTYYARVGADRLIREIVATAPMTIITAIGFYVCCGSFSVKDVAHNGPIAFIPLIGIFAGFVIVTCNRLRKSTFEYSMPHAMYQKDMNSLSDTFTMRDTALCEISSWYEKVVLYGFTYIFFANGTAHMTVVGIIVCIIMAMLHGVIQNMTPKFSSKRAFKRAWLIAFVLGTINLLVAYTIL